MTRRVACSFDVDLPDDHTHSDLFAALYQAAAELGGHVEGMVTFSEPGREDSIFKQARDADGAPLTHSKEG